MNILCRILEQSSVQLPSTLVERFCNSLIALADENSVEDDRICACCCFTDLFSVILDGNHDFKMLKECLVTHYFNFLSDEDCDVRSIAAFRIFKKLCPTADIPAHPNKVLVSLTSYLSIRCCDSDDINLFISLWNCKCYLESYSSETKADDHVLFQSSARNVYKEPHVLLTNIHSAFKYIFQNSTESLKEKIYNFSSTLDETPKSGDNFTFNCENDLAKSLQLILKLDKHL